MYSVSLTEWMQWVCQVTSANFQEGLIQNDGVNAELQESPKVGSFWESCYNNPKNIKRTSLF